MKRIGYGYIAIGALALIYLFSKFIIVSPRPEPIAYYLKAKDVLYVVAEGLDLYYSKHGTYPEIKNFKGLVEDRSPLVIQECLPKGIPLIDPWGHPYIGGSNGKGYRLECGGDPKNLNERPSFSFDSGHPPI